MLASAMMITSGFAAGGESNNIEGYLDASNGLNIKINKIVGPTGVIDMGSACLQISSGCELTNHGKIDISDVTDFSGYKGQVNADVNSVILIPESGKVKTKGKKNFKVTGDCVLKCSNVSYSCSVVDGDIVSSKTNSGVYKNLTEAVQDALGLKFSDTPVLTDTAVFTLKDLVNAGVNVEANIGCTYDIGDTNLAHRKLELEAEARMNFGFVSEADSTMEVKGKKLTIAGNCEGMLGKIKTDSDLEFKGVGSNGALEVAGMLSYVNGGSETIETNCAGEIKAGDLSLGEGVVLKCSGPLTIGWVKPVYLFPEDKIWSITHIYCYAFDNGNYGIRALNNSWEFNKGVWDGSVMDNLTVYVEFSSDDIGVKCNIDTGEMTYGELITKDETMTSGGTVTSYVGEITYREVADVFQAIKDGTAEYVDFYSAA